MAEGEFEQGLIASRFDRTFIAGVLRMHATGERCGLQPIVVSRLAVDAANHYSDNKFLALRLLTEYEEAIPAIFTASKPIA